MTRIPSLALAALAAAAICAPVFATTGALAASPAASSSPNPQLGTPPPQIYRVLSRPMCTQLRQNIMPAIAMMLQNDRMIAKSQPIFKDYLTTGFKNQGGKGAADTTDYDSPGRTMALQRMEDLVSPLAQNVIAIQKILENSSLAQPTGAAEDDKHLAQIRDQLLRALATQSASLDLINGFVTTQQLGDIQHVGLENLQSINGSELSSKQQSAMATPTADPMFQDPDAIGLPNNPYEIDPTKIPGLQVGYNPVSMIANGLHLVQDETSKRENGVVAAVAPVARTCAAPTTSTPPQSP